MYRAAWVIAFVLAIVALFTLGRPDTPKLSQDPATFDGPRAAADLRTLALEYPQRVAGSDADNRAALWVMQQFKRAGLEPHIDGVATTAGGSSVALQNVWAVSEGQTAGTILVIANRDVPPLATQGANDNASGVAAMLELARTFTVTAHQHSIVFLCTSGDAYGALGAGRFADAHDIGRPLRRHRAAQRRHAGRQGHRTRRLERDRQDGAAVALAALGPSVPVTVNSRSAPAGRPDAGAAPGCADELGQPGAVRGPGRPRHLPVLGGAAHPSAGRHGRRGVHGEPHPGRHDRVGHDPGDRRHCGPGTGSGGTIFLTRQRTLPGGSLAFILVVLLLPLAAVTVDLFAHGRRTRLPLRPAWKRAALHLAPWLVLVAIVYFANLVGLLPESPGAVIPPDSRVVASPRYLRVAILVVLLVLAYVYATAVERRLERRVPTDPRATIFVAHACLVLIALLVLLVNPYSLLLVLPAAVLWPLARPGGWTRSILPVYAGLGMILGAFVYFAMQLGLGWKVWWYFFLLLESRTVPVGVVLLGAVFVSTAGMLAHTLHQRTPGQPVVAIDGSGEPDGAEGAAGSRVRRRRTARLGEPASRRPTRTTTPSGAGGSVARRREARRHPSWPRRAHRDEPAPHGPGAPDDI